MRSHPLEPARSFVVAFDHGEDFFEALDDFCRRNQVRSGYIPMFIAGFSHARLVEPAKPSRTPVLRCGRASISPTSKRSAQAHSPTTPITTAYYLTSTLP